ncbi:AraC family transcriptional regulator [Flavobacterium sp.]|uniref:AraC family transcriptional regulator n=1 Tax=Flavobacterium sp. TaxID=239 RepID=UPI002B4B2BD9|nr:AraC family transcriptional regulator [Flavobacterium sp.]HLF51024.1 AraC family transcriptional regulator [Flavobacterium sp.]
MKYFQVLIFILAFFKSILSEAQNEVSIPDSLQKYSYNKLKQQIDKDNSIQKSTVLYSKAYLFKAKKENNSKEIIDGYFYVGRASNNFELNLKYADSAINIAKNRRMEDLSLLYWIKGCIYDDARKTKEALNYFLVANKHPNLSKDLEDRINFKIGSIKSTQGKHEEAILIYKKCEENARVSKFSNYLRYVLGLSELYQRINNTKLSEEYVKKGIAYCRDYKDGNFYLPYFVSNRGKNHFQRKQYQKAITDLKNPLEDIKKNNDFSNYAENCFYIGECYKKLHQENRAITYYKKVDSIFNVRKDIYLFTITAYDRLINYYKNQADYKKVLYYSDQFIKADKVLDVNYKYITDRITKNYDIQKVVASKQNIITSLRKDKIQFIILLMILFLGIIALIYLWHLNNIKKENELQKQKKLFEAYKKEREHQININKNQLKFSVKKPSLSNIGENVINHIVNCLEKFENEKWYINNEYTIDSLATEFKTNSGYLSKVINEIKNYSFTQYINTLRIEYILEKLETDKRHLKYTIQALSEISGFNSPQTFTRAFIAYTKMKPSCFIKELKNK